MNKLKEKKVLIGPSSFAALDSAPLDLLLKSGFEVIDNPYKRKLKKEELFNLLSDDVTALIAGLEPLDHEVLEGTNLKVISRVGSGLSNIDLNAAEELGVKVCYTPYGPTTAVAELTVGVILSLIRLVPQMDRALHAGEWKKMIGSQLKGKKVLIIGLGRIGKQVAELLSPFHVHIITVDPCVNDCPAEFELLPLDEALPQADIITIHSSGEDCILGDEEFNLMKEDVFIVNAARGGLVSEQALIKALVEGRVAGAWLDSFDEEPYDGPLLKFDQVVLTPHIGSYTLECRKQMESEAVENLINAFQFDQE